MMQRIANIGLTCALLTLSGFASAYDIEIRRQTVVPVVVSQDVRIRDLCEGDHFFVDVDRGNLLPWGTRFEARVSRSSSNRSRNGELSFEFVMAYFPDGRRERICARPISMNERYMTRDRNGHWSVKSDRRSQDTVFGGFVGGLILGSLIDKPFEGAVLGTLFGIGASEADRHRSDNRDLLRRGTRFGAAFVDDFRCDYRWDNRNGHNWDDRGRDDRGWGDRGRGNQGDNRGWDNNRGNDNRDNGRNNGRPGVDRWGDDPVRGEGGRPGDRPGRDAFDLTWQGRGLRFDARNQPYWDGQTLMVPVLEMGSQLGLHVESLSGGRKALLEADDRMATIEQDARDYRLNGKRETWNRPATMRDGNLFAPIELFGKLVGGEFRVNGTKIAYR